MKSHRFILLAAVLRSAAPAGAQIAADSLYSAQSTIRYDVTSIPSTAQVANIECGDVVHGRAAPATFFFRCRSGRRAHTRSATSRASSTDSPRLPESDTLAWDKTRSRTPGEYGFPAQERCSVVRVQGRLARQRDVVVEIRTSRSSTEPTSFFYPEGQGTGFPATVTVHTNAGVEESRPE